jgi:4-hydroxythreonine-4-phosphate dehydrogenase
MNMKKFVFTCGDINGIGPEVVIKTLNKIYHPQKHKIYFLCPGNVFKTSIRKYNPSFPFSIKEKYADDNSSDVIILNFTECEQQLGIPTRKSGAAGYKAIKIAFDLAVKEKVNAIITAPISKTALKLAGVKYPGHTEMLAEWSKVNKFMMMFLSSDIKCGLLTIHESISKISKLITEKRIQKSIQTAVESLQKDFGIIEPKIAVLGLNPHAGEKGYIGKEEEKIISPSVEKSKFSKFCSGPFVPDAFFASKQYLKFDFVIGMYHDQLLIPFKLLNFNTGVNYTAGLPIIRTSPDHGTAYDIAGKGIANANSIIDAFFWADRIIHNRYRNADKY